ncbi:MAG: hypothetical protein V4574_11515 [Pseudomonadota bacterium]
MARPFKWMLAALALFGSSGANGQTYRPTPSTGGVVIRDDDLGVRVSWADRGAETVFTVVMHQGWTLYLAIDGDRDRIWGTGPYDPKAASVRGADRQVTGHAADGYCGQYIHAADAVDPDTVGVASQCSATLFGGHVEESPPDAEGRVTTRYFLRTADIFGTRSSASLAFSVWDTEAHHPYFSPTAPLVVWRRPPATP